MTSHRITPPIATSASGLTVWDCDHGNESEEDLRAFMAAHDIAETYAVHTGQIKEVKSQKDAEAEAALAAILKESPDLGINKLRDALKEAGFRKGAKWVTKKRRELRGAGSGVTLTTE